MLSGMTRERALPGGGANAFSCRLVNFERGDHVVAAASNENFCLGLKELVQPGPPVANNRRPASCRFENPPRRAVTHRRHWLARDVQRPFGGGIERWVITRSNMPGEVDVSAPRKFGRILRASDQKAFVGKSSCGLDKQLLQRGLPVSGVCAEI